MAHEQGGTPMEWQFQASTAKAALSARPALAAFLRESCTPESDCDGAIIAFGELVTNVMVHAPGPIEVLVEADASGAVRIHVCDTGFVASDATRSIISISPSS